MNMSYFGCHPVMEWEMNSESWPRSVRSARSLQSLGVVAWLGSAIPWGWRWDVPQVEGSCREEGAHLWALRNKGLKLQGGQAPFGSNTHQEYHLHPRGAEKPPTNPSRVELVLPWCWAVALAAAAPLLPSQVTSSHVLPCPTPPQLFGC